MGIIAAVKVRFIAAGTTIDAKRGQVVVCIPVYAGHEHVVTCLRSVLQHTAHEVPILVCDDASPDARTREFVEKLERAELGEHRLFYLRRERNLGFPANVNGAFACAAPADVVILNSDCEVGAGWLDGLSAAAGSDSRVATVSTLTNHGSILSVPRRGKPAAQLLPDWSLEEAASAVRERSLRLRPRLPTAVGHCLYVRRSALELVGDFDLAFSPGYGEEVDFSQRCLHRGLTHLLADDVFVFHHGGASFSADGRRSPVQQQHERTLATRYPYYHPAIAALEEDFCGPVARSISVARRALTGLSVLIDARVLVGTMTGTQLQILEMIAALARTGSVRMHVIVPEDLSGYAREALSAIGAVELVTRRDLEDRGSSELFDLAHRPYQAYNDEDVAFLAPLAERLVITHLDLISYQNPAYFRSYETWEGYRRLTRAALAVADRVVFISAHAREDALAEDLIEPGRASVVRLGVDHALSAARPRPVAPRAAARLPDGVETILCLGTDFRHKNRIFALRLAAQLRARHSWEGRLVLAGPRVDHGSSRSDEAERLALDPGLSQAVVDVAGVTEAEKAWLYERATLVLYPTVHEGFGLVPFEAADHDVPCLWAAGTSLVEILPGSAAGLEPWDVEQCAGAAITLMRDESARAANLAAIGEAAAALSWDAATARLIEIYERTCDQRAAPAGSLERRHGVMTGVISEDAMRLVGPDGCLPPELERPLLAIAAKPRLSGPLFGAMKLGYRASQRVRGRDRSALARSGN